MNTLIHNLKCIYTPALADKCLALKIVKKEHEHDAKPFHL